MRYRTFSDCLTEGNVPAYTLRSEADFRNITMFCILYFPDEILDLLLRHSILEVADQGFAVPNHINVLVEPVRASIGPDIEFINQLCQH
jgi:hypothetical protein